MPPLHRTRRDVSVPQASPAEDSAREQSQRQDAPLQASPAPLSLREARMRRCLSIRALATAAHVSPRTVLMLEHRRTCAQLTTMRKLAQVLGVSPLAIAEFTQAIQIRLHDRYGRPALAHESLPAQRNGHPADHSGEPHASHAGHAAG